MGRGSVALVSGDRSATRRRVLAVVAATASLLLALAATSTAERHGRGRSHPAFVPPHHRIFHGVTDTGLARDYRRFNRRVGAHSALLESFGHWDGEHVLGGLHRWRTTQTRGVLSISTAPGGEPELISPRRIARGFGDDYILELNRLIARSRQVVYLRLFPEMNGYWNPYCAFNSNGSSRGASHSTRAFRDAWRRVVLIVRGGSRATINRRLAKQGMPRVYRARSNHDPVYARRHVPQTLARPRVAFMWVPQTIGSPSVRGNAPGDYWPGGRYVDWIGADIYSKFASPGVWSAFRRFYSNWRNPHRHHWPFIVGEYSPWDNDYRGTFTRRLFSWARHHRRVRALVYYRSVVPNNPFDINHWPRARAVIRHELNKPRFMEFAPGTRR
jgi:hypothetical protein